MLRLPSFSRTLPRPRKRLPGWRMRLLRPMLSALPMLLRSPPRSTAVSTDRLRLNLNWSRRRTPLLTLRKTLRRPPLKTRHREKAPLYVHLYDGLHQHLLGLREARISICQETVHSKQKVQHLYYHLSDLGSFARTSLFYETLPFLFLHLQADFSFFSTLFSRSCSI